MTRMLIQPDPSIVPDQAVAAFGEDRLLLEEANHRMLNELASATAALRLIASARGSRGRWRLLGEAIDRLEGSAAAQRLLSGPTPATTNVSRDVEALCRALVAARPDLKAGAMRLDVPDLWIDGATARRLLLVAAELVANALRHAFSSRPGELDVRTWVEGARAVLVVADDGPGIAAASPATGTGLGTPIVRELVARGGGTIACDSGPGGTTWTVSIPIAAPVMKRVRSGG